MSDESPTAKAATKACTCNAYLRDHECTHTRPLPVARPEPFCIKPTDRFALATIRCWISIYSAVAPRDPETKQITATAAAKIAGAEKIFSDFRKWQEKNGSKFPD